MKPVTPLIFRCTQHINGRAGRKVQKEMHMAIIARVNFFLSAVSICVFCALSPFPLPDTHIDAMIMALGMK
jgi:hypothetical protein